MTLSILFAFSQSHAQFKQTRSKLPKEQFQKQFETVLPESFCKEDEFYRKCFQVDKATCEKQMTGATKTCFKKMDQKIPSQLIQPQQGAEWGQKIGSCAATEYETSLKKAKRFTATTVCKDPKKWIKL